MIDKDGGGKFLDFMEGTHRAHGGSPQSPPLGKTLKLWNRFLATANCGFLLCQQLPNLC